MSWPNWKQNEKYTEGSIVIYNDKRRRCLADHTSEETFNDEYWKKMDRKEENKTVETRKYAAITSMNEPYYEHCGRAMLRSYKQHWHHLMPLYVYNEDNFEIKVKTVKSLGWDLGLSYEKFQKRHSNERVKTFAKKGFSIIHAMRNINAQRLIWVDADVIIQANIPHQMLDLISPDDVLSTHYSVWHEQDKKIYHSCETGFFILNTQHEGYKEFCDVYEDIYCNDRTEDLRRFYDGEVYGKTVEIMETKGYKMLNLNPGKHKTPIGRSVMAPYINHFKAGLKDSVDFSKFDVDDEV